MKHYFLFFAALCTMHAAVYSMEGEIGEHEAAIESAGDMFNKAQEEREAKEQQEAIAHKEGMAHGASAGTPTGTPPLLGEVPAAQGAKPSESTDSGTEIDLTKPVTSSASITPQKAGENTPPAGQQIQSSTASAPTPPDAGVKVELGFFDRTLKIASGFGKSMLGHFNRDASLHISAAEDYKAAGDHQSAAQAYWNAGVIHENAEERGKARNAYKMAADSFKDAQDLEQATYLYGRNGNYEAAADLLAQMGDNNHDTVSMYHDAIRQYERSASYMKKGSAEYIKKMTQIGDVYTKLSDVYTKVANIQGPNASSESAKSAGDAYTEAGKYKEAGDAYKKAGQSAKAEEAYTKASESKSPSNAKTQFSDTANTITKSISIDQKTQADTPKATPAISTETATTIKPDDTKSSITAEAPADVTTRTDTTKPKIESVSPVNSTETTKPDAADTAKTDQKAGDATSPITAEVQPKVSKGDAYIKESEQITLDSADSYREHAEKMSQAGDAYEKDNNFKSAADAYNKALESYISAYKLKESPDFSDAYNQTITKLADTYTKSGDFAKAGKIYEDLRWSDKLTSEERIELIKKSSDAYSKAIEKETNAQEKARLLSRKGIMQKALGNEAAAKEAHIQAGDLSFESGNLIFAMTEYSYADDEAKSKKAVDAYQASLKK